METVTPIFNIVVISILVVYAAGACTWPASFMSTTWLDSEAGSIVFGTTTLTGFQITVGVNPINLNAWECVLFDSTSSYLVMKTTDAFEQFVNSFFTAYKCLQITQVTGSSYRYYELGPIQSNAQNKRLNIIDDPNQTNVSELCLEDHAATGSEYRMLIQSGSESASRVMCPYNIVANYSYTYTATDGSVTCNPSTDIGQMDMCSDTTSMTFQYPACTSLTFYTSASSIWCADVVTVGNDLFVTTYNGEQTAATIDDTNSYSFSCIGISSDGTSASVTPQYCKASQSTSQIPVDNAGTSVGAVLSLSSLGDFCPPCPSLSAPSRGSVSIATDGAVTTATYVCEASYTLAGDATRTCQSNGTWSGSTPSCTCPLPVTPTNGTMTLSADGTTLTYTCDVGTVLNGVTTRTCQTDTNTWTDTDPTCATCTSLTSPQNGSFSLASTSVTSIVTYGCDSGTSLNGNTNRTCQTDTTWDGTDPTCTSCPTLPNPDSGTVSITTTGVMSIATYMCVTGYSLVGDNNATCSSNGVWDNTAPTCVCDPPSNPDNGSVSVASSGLVATFTCDVRFTLSGADSATCQPSGAGWNVTFPTCVECASVVTPANGSVTYSTNGTATMATYSCSVGYTMDGSSSSTCSANGAWTTTEPSCALCDTLPVLTSGNITLTTDGTTTSATYICDVGSTLSSDVVVSCASNGTWTASSSNISCVTCTGLSTVTGGSFDIVTNGTTSTATLTCQSGYTVSGTSEVACLPDGTWSLTVPTCVGETSSDSNSKDNSLLPAVIALAILSALLAAALIASIIYIWRNRKNKDSGDTPEKSRYEKMLPAGTDSLAVIGKMLDDAAKSSAAPTGHQRPVFNGTASLSRAPPSHLTDSGEFHSPRTTTSSMSLRSGTLTPRSVKSVVSTGNMKLSLVKEATNGSILNQEVPAPWALQKKPQSQSTWPFNDSQKSSNKDKNKDTILSKEPSTILNQRKSLPRFDIIDNAEDKKRNSNPLIPSKTKPKESLKLDLSGVTNDTNGSNRAKRRSTKSPRNERSLQTHMSKDGPPERATTPVRHYLTVKDTETPRTPRSGTITTVH